MAITLTEQFHTVMGDHNVAVHKVTFDGSATTVNLPVGTIDFACVMAGADASGTSETSGYLSWSGSTLTFDDAHAATHTSYVFWMGTA